MRGSRPERAASPCHPQWPGEWSWWCADWLTLPCFYSFCSVFLYLINVLNQEERQIRVYIVSVVSCHFENWQLMGCWPNKSLLHQRRLIKKMPVPIHGLRFHILSSNYEWELLSHRVSCIKSMWIISLTGTFHIKTEHFNVGFYAFFSPPHLILTLPPLYSGVMCNAEFGERHTHSNHAFLILLSFSPQRLGYVRARGETRRHISTFGIS